MSIGGKRETDAKPTPEGFVLLVPYFYPKPLIPSPMHMNHHSQLFAIWICLVLLGGCQTADYTPEVDLPALETRADSVAMRAYEAWGGPEAWARLHFLGFEFAFEPNGGERRPGRKHFWDRWTGDYRIEWEGGEDSTYVVLFNVNARDGDVFLNGSAVDTNVREDLLARAY